MLYDLEWGHHEKFLKNLEKQTGETPAALQRKPKLLSFVEIQYYDAYNTINHSRTHYGEGVPNPLQVSEILAYITLAGVQGRVYAMRLFALVKKMDQAYLTNWFKKNSNG